MCNVKPGTVYAWISRKELQAHRVGRTREISKEQLAEFLSRRRFDVVIDMTRPNR
jgi:excisionase family DNA binding protein